MEYSDEPDFKPSRDGVLVLSGNRISIHTENGLLKIASGDAEVSYARATCPLTSIVVTRDQGYISFSAIHWLHDKGISLSHLNYSGEPFLASAPGKIDLPKLRRAQALAVNASIGAEITRELLRTKVAGQSSMLSAMGEERGAKTLSDATAEIEVAPDLARMLVIESTAATLYWRAWRDLLLRFARRTTVPSHWQSFGVRQSNLSNSAYHAMSPGGSLLNYLYGLAAVEMRIALSALGLDPGIGIFHVDRENRDSLTYDALEAIRPAVDLWLWRWLSTAVFSKRDFYELQDGGFRVTRPLSSHLALTKLIWRRPAEAVASWIAKAFAKGGAGDILIIPWLDHSPRSYSQGHFPKPSCLECGRMLPERQRRFCSSECDLLYRNAATDPAHPPLKALRASAVRAAQSLDARKRRQATQQKQAFQRATWETAYFERGGTREQLVEAKAWFIEMIYPRLATVSPSALAAVLSATFSYGSKIRNSARNGVARKINPHPSHYLALAKLVGVEPPAEMRRLLDFSNISTGVAA